LGYMVLSVVLSLPQAMSWPPAAQQKLVAAPQAACARGRPRHGRPRRPGIRDAGGAGAGPPRRTTPAGSAGMRPCSAATWRGANSSCCTLWPRRPYPPLPARRARAGGRPRPRRARAARRASPARAHARLLEEGRGRAPQVKAAPWSSSASVWLAPCARAAAVSAAGRARAGARRRGRACAGAAHAGKLGDLGVRQLGDDGRRGLRRVLELHGRCAHAGRSAAGGARAAGPAGAGPGAHSPWRCTRCRCRGRAGRTAAGRR